MQDSEAQVTSLEILAPAGNHACLDAALEAGADAVYFGLPVLNARRGASNFSPNELGNVIQKIHEAAARAILTLNIDVKPRELGQAARALELSRQCGVDAVLIRDPALLALKPYYPELLFYWSTQAGVCSPPGIQAAKRFNITRVVLPREMNREEVAVMTGQGVETEIFVQGALCFCFSGACFLSSWGGGRSGNRGLCTSPCRVEWENSRGEKGRFMSMYDLCLIHRLKEIMEAGVTSCKIEGRLKKASWVREAVKAYKSARDGWLTEECRELVERLGDYAGRPFTTAFFDDFRQNITGDAARPGRREKHDNDVGGDPDKEASEAAEMDSCCVLNIIQGEDRFHCSCSLGGVEEEWSMPLARVRYARRGIAVGEIGTIIENEVNGASNLRFYTNAEEVLVPRKNVKAVKERVKGVIHRATKPADRTIRMDLPTEVRTLVDENVPSRENKYPLGSTLNRVRLDVDFAESFLKEETPESVVLENVTSSALENLTAEFFASDEVIVALPKVFFTHDVPELEALVAGAKERGFTVEVNSWDGWQLACDAGCSWIAGPGLPVTNQLAARELQALGAESVTLSLESDREMLAELSAAVPLSHCVYVFGRPVLAASRVAGEGGLTPGRRLQDKRGIKVVVFAQGELTLLRPEAPFDLTDVTNERITARYFGVDLVTSPDPLAEWRCLGEKGGGKERFNYFRKLQ